VSCVILNGDLTYWSLCENDRCSQKWVKEEQA